MRFTKNLNFQTVLRILLQQEKVSSIDNDNVYSQSITIEHFNGLQMVQKL